MNLDSLEYVRADVDRVALELRRYLGELEALRARYENHVADSLARADGVAGELAEVVRNLAALASTSASDVRVDALEAHVASLGARIRALE